MRFHFGELAVSVPWRAAQVAGIGVSPRALSIWRTCLLVAIMFHDSNTRLPVGLERWVSRILVTPRMHGIHPSIVADESDSNWSSGLAIWDWLHGTVRLNVPRRNRDRGCRVPVAGRRDAARDRGDVVRPPATGDAQTAGRPIART